MDEGLFSVDQVPRPEIGDSVVAACSWANECGVLVGFTNVGGYTMLRVRLARGEVVELSPGRVVLA